VANLPASFSGGLQVLIERLQSGMANEADQAWAAKLLAAAERSIGAKARRAYVDTREARDHHIYLDVCAELARVGDDDVQRACAVVAARFRVMRERVDSGAEEMHPTMHPATVEKIYEEQRQLELTLADWRRQSPLMQSLTAEEHGVLDRLRLERAREAEGATEPASLPWTAGGTEPPGWLEVLAAYVADNAK